MFLLCLHSNVCRIFSDDVPEGTLLNITTNHKDLLRTDVTSIKVDESTGIKKWPIWAFGLNAGHDILKVETDSHFIR